MKFVCPVPIKWSEIFLGLEKAWKINGQDGPPPPMPLILGGWRFSGDQEKNTVWNLSIEWAKKYGFEHLIPELKPEEMYMVNEYSFPYIEGLFWDMTTKEKPEPSDLENYLMKLKKNWGEIAGPHLRNTTYPRKFSGKKKRCLRIYSSQGQISPWGEWNRFTNSHGKLNFRDFREKINKAISPHEVDHIVFTEIDFERLKIG